MSDSYEKLEVDLKLERLSSKLETNHIEVLHELAQHRETHSKILDQAKLTNGRVKRLEIWKAGLAGGMTILSIIVVPLLLVYVKGL